MKVTRLEAARPYEAARHFGMVGLRLQGHNASPADGFWVGLSYFLPGGGAQESSTDLEKVYVVVEGEVTVVTPDGAETLGPLDSCWLAPGESRAIENRSNRPATMLVVMPYAPA